MIVVHGAKWAYSGDLEEDLNLVVGEKANIALTILGQVLKKGIEWKLDQAGSGRTYPSKRGDGTDHVASAPGEPPAPDTGEYRDSMEVHVRIYKWTYRLEFRSRFWKVFGRRLELGGWGGGAYIAPRPHVRPVFEENMVLLQKTLDDM